MQCASCGGDLPDGARFCPRCGAETAAPGPGGTEERRVATVVFADLVGFTTLSETRDPEQVKGVVDRCLEQMVDAVHSCDGTVDKIIGDAVVALFGAPVAHEDDAERAVRAALRMRSALRELSERSGVEVRLRVGVNTGEVVVGALRAGGDYTAMGDAVNVASRLQTLAEPDQILVGPQTHESTRHTITYEALGERRVKGRDTAVPVWAASSAAPLPAGRVRRSGTPLVGRDVELEVIEHSIGLAISRRRALLVLLTGDAGMGKERLAAEAAERAAAEHGVLVASGRAVPYGAPSPWWPLAEVLRSLCGVEADDPPARARGRIVEAVVQAFGEDRDDPRVQPIAQGVQELAGLGATHATADPERTRDQSIAAAGVFLGARAARRPLVVTLNELHWADDVLLDLSQRLLDALSDVPFVLVGAGRPELRERWVPPRGRQLFVELHLDPLEEAATRDLAELLLGREIDADVAHEIFERSGGNPLFVEELTALWGDRVTRGAGELPASLQGLIAARLDTLDAETRSVLEDAAVVGARGPIESVVAMSESRGPTSAPDALATLTREGLLARDDGDFAFTSDLVREVTYSRLTKAERARRHASVATWMDEWARHAPRPGDVLDAAAHHHGSAGELALELGEVAGAPSDLAGRGFAALEDAAARAVAAELWGQAERSFARALPLAPPDPAVRHRLLLGRSEARANLLRLADARRDVEAVLADELHAGEHAEALTRLADVQQRGGELERAAATLDEAIASWRDLGDDGGLARALRIRGLVEVFAGRLDVAQEWTEQARVAFRAVGDRQGEAWALETLALGAFLAGDHDVAGERLRESQTVFDEIGDWGGLLWARGLEAWVVFGRGDLEGAERLAREVRGDDGIGDRWGAALTGLLLANLALWRGQVADACREADAAAERLAEAGDLWSEMQARVISARATFAAGDPARALELVDRAGELDQQLRNSGPSAPHIVRALLLAQLGRSDAALAEIGRLEEHARARGVIAFVAAEQRYAHSLALGLRGEAGAGAELARDGLADRSGGQQRTLGPLAGLLLCADGRPDEARRVLGQVPDPEHGTYHDRMMHALSSAAVATALGTPDGPRCIEGARAAVGDEAPIDVALVDLASARFAAEPAGTRTRRVLADAGVDVTAWSALFDAAGRR